MEHPIHFPIHLGAATSGVLSPGATPTGGTLGYIPVQASLSRSQPEWGIDRLLRTSGVIAVIIGSLVFLTVYAYVDALSQLFRELIPSSNPPFDTVGLQQVTGSHQTPPLHIHHRRPSETNLSFKWKLVYALILTLITIFVSYFLLYVWKHFELK
jgi:hypothetical protein